MSLLEESMENFIILNKKHVSDGYGGYLTVWENGEKIKLSVILDSSMNTKIAESQGFTNIYTITSKKELKLDFHDVVKRTSDNKIFRITNDGSDNETPKNAKLNMRQYSAEEWSLPT